ncbi:MAG: hypothetical protein C0404_11300, partial [Verrucomicrobia bacterium]|nr:hypothetical protein [Verrucomicrobiota bacterium]
GEWMSVAPATNTVDMEAIDGILFLASNMRALRIETDNPKNLAAYGLDRSGTVLTLGLSGAEGIQKTLITGFKSRTDGVFATVQGQDIVFVLDNAILAQATRDLNRPPVTTANAKQPGAGASDGK